jgi:hypothetical protein
MNICDLQALGLHPKNVFICKFCLISLKMFQWLILNNNKPLYDGRPATLKPLI